MKGKSLVKGDTYCPVVRDSSTHTQIRIGVMDSAAINFENKVAGIYQRLGRAITELSADRRMSGTAAPRRSWVRKKWAEMSLAFRRG